MFLFDSVDTETTSRNHYNTLGVSSNATSDEIKSQFRKLAMQHHPDKGGDAEKFNHLKEAYEILRSAKSRALYDKFGDRVADPARRPGTSKPEPVRVVLPLPLRDFYCGTSENVSYDCVEVCLDCSGRGGYNMGSCLPCQGTGSVSATFQMGPVRFQKLQSCDACSGNGETFASADACRPCNGTGFQHRGKTLVVNVDVGLSDGHELMFRDQGDMVLDGHERGDVVVLLEEQNAPNSPFLRIGTDVIVNHTVSLAAALSGDSIFVALPDGGTLRLSPESEKIIAPGDVLRVDGRGMVTTPGGLERGALFVVFRVAFPTALPSRSRLLAKLILPASEPSGVDPDATDVPWVVGDKAEITHITRTANETRRRRRYLHSASADTMGDIAGCRQQ